MVMVTRLNGKVFYVNPDMIEFIEETPDTVVTLTTGKKLVVVESAELLIERVINYRREVFVKLPLQVKQQD